MMHSFGDEADDIVIDDEVYNLCKPFRCFDKAEQLEMQEQ